LITKTSSAALVLCTASENSTHMTVINLIMSDYESLLGLWIESTGGGANVCDLCLFKPSVDSFGIEKSFKLCCDIS
jgi:hypothetical protein